MRSFYAPHAKNGYRLLNYFIVLRFFFSIYLFLVLTGTFDLQVYTVTDCEVPQDWDETQPCFIANAQEMPLRTFSTSLHRVETHVSYKAE
jgi:mitotic spindle assembly checkpoint protein MAD2